MERKMKTLTKAICSLAFIFSATGFAAPQKDCVQKWTGTGTIFGADGREEGSYNIEVINTESSDHIITSERRMTDSAGHTEVVTLKITENERGFTIESELGNGGGRCYGKDLCESYIASENGCAFATTIVKDGVDTQRNLTFKLKDGKAVRIFRENLALVK